MASKRGPLSKAEVFYISEHAKSGKDINEIATDLDRPVKSIEKCYTTAQTKTQKPLTAGSQFARTKGSVVMTENASTLADTKRKQRVVPSKTNCTTTIKNN
jgi:hypothetical protein